MLCRGVAVFDGLSVVTRLAGSQTDITQRKLAELHLEQNALHDSLTGLPNRKQFINKLMRLIDKDERDKNKIFAVLFIDLDGFKNVNDIWGHDIGDQYLVQTARRLESCIRPGDMAARLGGDEFTVLLENIDEKNDAIKIANRILTELNTPIPLLSGGMPITASIGIAFSYPECADPEDLIRNADAAMYSAKSSGKNRFALHNTRSQSRRLILTQPRISYLHIETYKFCGWCASHEPTLCESRQMGHPPATTMRNKLKHCGSSGLGLDAGSSPR